MVFIEDIINLLKKKKISFYTGVPDSILKNLILKFKKKIIFQLIMKELRYL